MLTVVMVGLVVSDEPVVVRAVGGAIFAAIVVLVVASIFDARASLPLRGRLLATVLSVGMPLILLGQSLRDGDALLAAFFAAWSALNGWALRRTWRATRQT